MMNPENQEKALDLNQKAFNCLKEDQFDEAINFLSEALLLDPSNSLYYCNRSHAYLKKKMFYFAMQDATTAILLSPAPFNTLLMFGCAALAFLQKATALWTVYGYIRKAEIEYLIGDYSNSLVSYAFALKYQRENPKILLKMIFINEKRKAQVKARSQVPWLGAGFGIIIAVFVMVTNHITCSNPFIKNPLLIVLTTILIAVFGFSCGLAINTFKKYQQEQMLKPPKDIKENLDTLDTNNTSNIESKENDKEDEQIIKKNKRTNKVLLRRCLKKRKNPRANYTNLS